MRPHPILQWLLQRYWRITRPLTLGAQGCVLTPDNHVLLVRHSYRPGWHFPGGGIEKNETALTALTRELNEEAGIIIDSPPRLHGIFANFPAFPSDHVIVYVVRDWSQPIAPKPNREIAEHGFYAPNALPEGTSDATKHRLAEILNGAEAAQYW